MGNKEANVATPRKTRSRGLRNRVSVLIDQVRNGLAALTPLQESVFWNFTRLETKKRAKIVISRQLQLIYMNTWINSKIGLKTVFYCLKPPKFMKKVQNVPNGRRVLNLVRRISPKYKHVTLFLSAHLFCALFFICVFLFSLWNSRLRGVCYDFNQPSNQQFLGLNQKAALQTLNFGFISTILCVWNW